MMNFDKKTMPNDLLWFVKRYNALLVEFPKEITPELLKKDDICSRYDSEEAINSLKSAHDFLTSIASEMLIIPEQQEERLTVIEKVFSKIDLIWALGFYGELKNEGNEYYLAFSKPLKGNAKTLPANYSKSFDNITENGCWVEYFKNGKEVKDYKACGNGVIHFDNGLTALGIYLYIKKCTQKRWYWEEDIAGNYTKALAYIPVMHCAEPYHRADMRIFICGERLKYDYLEHTAGYKEEMVGYFKQIYEFIEKDYPQCLPCQGFFNYVNCSVTFSLSAKHRMLGQIGVGGDEHSLGFYTGLAGKEMIEFMSRIDEFKPKILGNSLVEIGKNISEDSQVNEITYQRQRYIFRDSKTKEFRFSITEQSDVEQIIKLMDIKARHKQKTIK